MKKSLISMAALRAAAALAAAMVSSNQSFAATAQVMKHDPNAGNDERFGPQENNDALCLSGDVRPIHIGGGCSDIGTQWPNAGVIKRSISDSDGIACTGHLDSHTPAWMVPASRRTVNVAALA